MSKSNLLNKWVTILLGQTVVMTKMVQFDGHSIDEALDGYSKLVGVGDVVTG